MVTHMAEAPAGIATNPRRLGRRRSRCKVSVSWSRTTLHHPRATGSEKSCRRNRRSVARLSWFARDSSKRRMTWMSGRANVKHYNLYLHAQFCLRLAYHRPNQAQARDPACLGRGRGMRKHCVNEYQTSSPHGHSPCPRKSTTCPPSLSSCPHFYPARNGGCKNTPSWPILAF